MAEVELSHVTKAFGEQAAAVNDVSFTAGAGDFVALLGPSGCGKSTTLRLIAGLETSTGGVIRIGGRDVTGAAPAERGISMVFQSYALFPHLSVRQNIVFGLEVRGVEKQERARRLERAVEILGLGPYLDRKPSQLSGGQQQRVALGRAIVAETPVCLMDEPLSNLDAQLRLEMRREIRALQRRLGLTLIYVTHDQVEAMTMADRIVLMNAGRIEQYGTPEELYDRPATIFTARFVGTPPMNVLPVTALGEAAAHYGSRGLELAKVSLGVRPEAVRLSDDGIHASVTAVEYLGADCLLEARIGDHAIVARIPGKFTAGAGETVRLAFDASAVHHFDSETGRRIQ
ncbi:ATP-binding cassette domain-containing protein [Phreatobacter aquaticus]|uniref:ATP-binding cassette domain-containing protein n=1 Tax=Phreatobacter aquaticus TaxID=2570229 RepID=A0A4D7QDM5_9HYPH|nr:ATP-binding cassette domain-containing protein [Phreatobacter aquaticus]QCK84551.1 ATP-binding cassette domain-containing protein [Phreatobacter aquaticus]